MHFQSKFIIPSLLRASCRWVTRKHLSTLLLPKRALQRCLGPLEPLKEPSWLVSAA